MSICIGIDLNDLHDLKMTYMHASDDWYKILGVNSTLKISI